MNGRLYVIFDLKAKNFGDVLTFDNDEEAKRFFIHSCVNCDWFKELVLLCLGEITTFDNTTEVDGVGVKINPLESYFEFVCYGSDVSDEVDELIKKRVELDTLRLEIGKSLRRPQFVDDVEKLSRYLSKHDKKRFNK